MATSKWSLEDHTTIIRDELSRTDSKSATLVGLAGIAAVYASGANPPGAGALPRILAFLAALAFTASLLVVLLAVLRPHIDGGGWCRYASLPIDHIVHLSTHDEQPAARSGDCPTPGHMIAAQDLSSTARLARRKFIWIQLSIDLMAIGTVLLVASRFPALLACAV